VIVDVLVMKDNYREEFYKEFMPYHLRSGLDMDLLTPLIRESGLEIAFRSEDRGLITLAVEPLEQSA
jgi:hypothetical protein